MGAATVYSMPFGYVVYGDTGEATVNSGETIRVKAMAFSGDDNTDTCTITSERKHAEPISSFKFKTSGNDDDAGVHNVWFGENGSPFKNMKVTLNDAQSVLYIYVV